MTTHTTSWDLVFLNWGVWLVFTILKYIEKRATNSLPSFYVSLAGFRWRFNSLLDPFWGYASIMSILGISERSCAFSAGSKRLFRASQGKNSTKSFNNTQEVWLDYILHSDHHQCIIYWHALKRYTHR